MSGFIHNDYTVSNSNSGAGEVVVLKTSTILSILEELNIHELNKNDLAEPQRSREKIRRVYWCFLQLLRGVTEEELEMRSKAMSQVHPHPDDVEAGASPSPRSAFEFSDLHEGLADGLFFKELRLLMKICHVEDFSWRDLHAPTPKRIRCIMSALINCAKFATAKQDLFNQLMEQRRELMFDLEEITHANDELLGDLAMAEAEKEVKIVETEQITQEINSLEDKIASATAAQSDLRKTSEKEKRMVSDLEEKVDETKWDLAKLQQEEQELMAQVVSSPVRRKTELAVKKEGLCDIKADFRNLQAELQNRNVNTANVKQATQSVNDLIAMQNLTLQDAKKHYDVVVQDDAMKKKIATISEQSELAESECAEAERNLQRAEEKFDHIRDQFKVRMDSAQKDLEAARSRLLQDEGEHRENLALLRTLKSETEELEATFEASKSQAEQEILALVEEYKITEKAILKQLENRAQLMV